MPELPAAEVRNVGWWWVPDSLGILMGFQVWAEFGFLRHYLMLTLLCFELISRR